MAYDVRKSDNTIISTVQDGTSDNSATSLTFIGRRFADYGLVYNENHLHLLENFADQAAPNNPIVGQLWFDKTPGAESLKVYLSTGQWVPLTFSLDFSDTSINQQVNFIKSVSFFDLVTFESSANFKGTVSITSGVVNFIDGFISGNPTFNSTSSVTFDGDVSFNSAPVFNNGFSFTGGASFDGSTTYNSTVTFSSSSSIIIDSSSLSVASNTDTTFEGSVNINSDMQLTAAILSLDNQSYIHIDEALVDPSTGTVAKLYSRRLQGNDPSTVVLLTFNGADGSTTITDSSLGTLVNGGTEPNNVIAATGNAAITIYNRKFGTGSLALDGTGDYVTITDNTNFDLGVDEFTFDCWLYTLDVSNDMTIFSKGTSATNRFELITTSSGTLQFLWNDGVNTISISGGSIPTDEWVHVALERIIVTTNSMFNIYVNGTRVATTTVVSATYDFDTITGNFEIGRRVYGTFEYFSGNFDDIRLVKGEAKFQGAFTPRNNPINGSQVMAFLTNSGVPFIISYEENTW